MLAQVAAEVRRSYVAHPTKVRVSDFLPIKSQPRKSSKEIWLEWIGLDPKKQGN